MQQLTCTRPGVVEWREVPEPLIQEPTDALVRPVAVARCEIDPLLVLVGPTSDDGFAVGHEAVVEVADDGPGIAPEVLPRIWEAFFTTKPPGEGSGLGLDNARRIVERRHHGTIDVDTGAAGTTFTVRLPLGGAA